MLHNKSSLIEKNGEIASLISA